LASFKVITEGANLRPIERAYTALSWYFFLTPG
jgi:hypothetical protein